MRRIGAAKGGVFTAGLRQVIHIDGITRKEGHFFNLQTDGFKPWCIRRAFGQKSAPDCIGQIRAAPLGIHEAHVIARGSIAWLLRDGLGQHGFSLGRNIPARRQNHHFRQIGPCGHALGAFWGKQADKLFLRGHGSFEIAKAQLVFRQEAPPCWVIAPLRHNRAQTFNQGLKFWVFGDGRAGRHRSLGHSLGL